MAENKCMFKCSREEVSQHRRIMSARKLAEFVDSDQRSATESTNISTEASSTACPSPSPSPPIKDTSMDIVCIQACYIFENISSYIQIGQVQPGEVLQAAGPAVDVDGFFMQPIL